MKKCLVYGNCQTSAIRLYLKSNPEFSTHYSLIDTKPVHLLSEEDVPYLKEIITDVDLFIHQRVSDHYKGIPQLSTRYLKEGLKPGCQVILLPVAYFTGYNPEMIHMKGENGAALLEPFPSPYHDVNILSSYVKGKSVQETLEIIQGDKFYSLDYVEKNLNKTLENLRTREKDFDVKLSDFIETNFRSNRLFHTFNHPYPIILAFICNSILEILELPTGFFPLNNPDVLARDSFPIYPSLSRNLKIEFDSTSSYRFDNKDFAMNDTIEKFFNFYEANHDVAHKNLQNVPDLSSNPWVYGN